MAIFFAGILVSLVAMPLLARPLSDVRRRRIVALLATASAILGWVALAYTVWGPSYQGIRITIDGTGQRSEQTYSASLLEVGLDPRAAAVLIALTLSFATLTIGALAHVTKGRLGRWLMLASLVVPLAVGSLSFGFAGIVPAAILAVAATRLAFLAPPAQPSLTTRAKARPS